MFEHVLFVINLLIFYKVIFEECFCFLRTRHNDRLSRLSYRFIMHLNFFTRNKIFGDQLRFEMSTRVSRLVCQFDKFMKHVLMNCSFAKNFGNFISTIVYMKILKFSA